MVYCWILLGLIVALVLLSIANFVVKRIAKKRSDNEHEASNQD